MFWSRGRPVRELSIYSCLKHRADVHRRKATWSDGAAAFSYQQVGENVRVFFQPEEFEAIQEQTIENTVSQTAYLLFHPSEDIEPGDTVTLRAPLSGRYTVTGRLALLSDPTGNRLDHVRAQLEPIPTPVQVVTAP